MIRYINLAVVLILINVARTLGLNPPQDVKIGKKLSELLWKPPEDDDSLLYSLQYTRDSCNNSEDEWHNVFNHTRTKSRSFNITEDFYGAVFRVRTEKGQEKSEWKCSESVQCAKVNFCAPVVNPSVKREMVFLNMGHMDNSLLKEFGDNIKFNISFWKVDNDEHSKVESFTTNSMEERFDDLESGQSYCFQVEYLLYEQPYGKATKRSCVVIPETPEVKRMRAFIYSALITLFASVLCGVCILILTKHRNRLKQWLQPLQLDIPPHYEEFLSGACHLQMFSSPSSQSLQSCDMITVIENTSMEQNSQEEEQEKKSLT